MASALLTKTTVDKAAPKSERYELLDTKLSGFGVRITPSGAKTFFVSYRAGDGGRSAAKRRVTIAKFGTLTVEEARDAAQKLLSSVKLGADPATARAARRETVILRELSKRFLQAHVEAKRKAGTAAHYADVLNRIVVPKLGNVKVDMLTRADLAQLHSEWASTPFQANRMLAIVGSMYTFGARVGLVAEGFNPARGIERFPEHGRERYLSQEELERIGASIRLAETDGLPWETDVAAPGAKHLPKNVADRRTKISKHAAAALRLLIFTGARLREILHLRWSEVDLQRGLLLLSDSKTGRKPIILNAPAMEILDRLERIGEFVIAGEQPDQPRKDLKRPWAAVSRAAGLDGVRLHDLRHTFASYGATGGLGLPIIGKLLGHTNASTTQRYAHIGADPLRKASDAIGATIAHAMGEATIKPSADIVVLKKN